MKFTSLIVFLVAGAVTAAAQTPAKPAAPAAKPATAARTGAAASAVKLPPGVPAVKGVMKSAFQVSLRYQDVKIGTGAVADTKKIYKIQYTGWRAADGVKFDSSYDHPGVPLKDKDGKPVMGPDGKPKLGDPQPASFPQGVGGLIVGIDQGLVGMKVGGKRRIFVPWQLGYGTRDLPARGADHPGIPPKSDLIFDVELVDVADLPAPMMRPGMPGGMQRMPPRPGQPPVPGSPNGAAAPAQPGAPATAPKPAAAASAAPAPTTAPAPAPAKAPAPQSAPAAPATPAPNAPPQAK